MFKNITVILVVFFCIVGCNDSAKIEKPDNLIAKDKMSNILYDLYIINAAKGVNRKLLEVKGIIPETFILTKYNIDSTQFADSNTYYAFNNETYKTIVENVKTRLEEEKKVFEDIREEQGKLAKVRRDSISAKKQKRRDSTNKIKIRDSIVLNLSKKVQ